MKTTVRVFELPYKLGEKLAAPLPPTPVNSFVLEADGVDHARSVARERLAQYGWAVKTLNYSAADGSELSAVIYKRD